MLEWPIETVSPEASTVDWRQSGSNIVLDFHGDPMKAKLAVFSDGNHHMALLPALRAFYVANPQVEDIFYATTPPAPIVSLLKTGSLRLGHLVLSVRPHVFISPPHVLESLKDEGWITTHRLLARNQGSVLLVRHSNPKAIRGIKDLMRKDVRLFVSNPDTETVSYEGYRQTLEGMAASQGIPEKMFAESVFGESMVRGERIHHREAPEAVWTGMADAAVVYYHLALRYSRIFPQCFDFIPLGGTKTHPAPPPENRTADIHISLVGDGGPWGARLLEFMQGRTVEKIYAENGLIVP